MTPPVSRSSSLGEVCAARLVLRKRLEQRDPGAIALHQWLFGSGIDWFAATVRTR